MKPTGCYKRLCCDLSLFPLVHSCPLLILPAQVFTLPKVSAKMKLKLTAIDGSRVRRVGVSWFSSSRTEDYGESGLVVLTNQGDLHVVSLPHVKMQVHYPCVRKEDVSGIASCVFTKHGQGESEAQCPHTAPHTLTGSSQVTSMPLSLLSQAGLGSIPNILIPVPKLYFFYIPDVLNTI